MPVQILYPFGQFGGLTSYCAISVPYIFLIKVLHQILCTAVFSSSLRLAFIFIFLVILYTWWRAIYQFFFLWLVLYFSYLRNLYLPQGHKDVNFFSFKCFIDFAFIFMFMIRWHMVWGKGWRSYIRILNSSNTTDKSILSPWNYLYISIDKSCVGLLLDFILLHWSTRLS